MKTILVSGSDTGIGKTWTVGMLARLLGNRGDAAQIVKPVESGVTDPNASDAASAWRAAGSLSNVSAHTLRSYRAALAPVAAAGLEGDELSFDRLVADTLNLPPCDWRIVEGAGSIAAPLDRSGRDWSDFAVAVGADAVVLVVEDRLGAIGQARMALAYVERKGLLSGVWLNELSVQDEDTRRSTREGLVQCGIAVWGESRAGCREPDRMDRSWL